MKKYLAVFMLLLLAFTLQGCSQQENGDTNGNGYPAPEAAALEDAYLAPVLSGSPNLVSGALDIPAPSTGKAVVHGKIQTADGKAFAGSVFIGVYGLYIREGYPPPMEVLSIESPMVVLNNEGQFFFADVQPGVYSFVALTANGPQIITVNGSPVTVEVQADQTVDAGVLVVP